jgi:hypothetical protein
VNRVAAYASIQKLHDELKDDHVPFVRISDEDVPTIERFLKGRSLALPVFPAPG